MKLILFKKTDAKVAVENLDDLWYLSSIIDPGDIVEGKTERKIKIGESGDRNQKVIKKIVFLKIAIENIEFHQYASILRVSGKIVDGPEDIARGSYHTFNVEPNTTIKIIKEEWLRFQSEKLKEACEKATPKVLICLFDREDCYIAVLTKQGYKILTNLKGNVAKKQETKSMTTNFYTEILDSLKEYDSRYSASNIILASPAFWKEDFLKNVKDQDIKKKFVLATASSVDEKAINEVLKRPETQTVLKSDRVAKELKLVEQLLDEISKEGLAVYGIKETKTAIDAGAVKILLVTDHIIQKLRLQQKFNSLNKLMKNADKVGADIVIISSDHDAGKKLDGLGGIGSILRYKI